VVGLPPSCAPSAAPPSGALSDAGARVPPCSACECGPFLIYFLEWRFDVFLEARVHAVCERDGLELAAAGEQ
jgi:hypothetical protein